MRRLAYLLLFSFLLLPAPLRPLTASEPVTVFAAASLTDALLEIAEAYEEAGGRAPRFSFAASSTLARQIEAGAPADIFLCANILWMDRLEERGLIQPGSRREPLGNALAVVAPAEVQGPSGQAELDPSQIAAVLPWGGRLVIGDPAHVPAGIYAQEALRSLGLWDALEERLVFAGDVRAALALVERAEAALGVVYETDAAATPRVEVVARLPESSHSPIRYSFARLPERGEDLEAEASAFYRFLSGEEAAGIFQRFGFAVLSAPAS